MSDFRGYFLEKHRTYAATLCKNFIAENDWDAVDQYFQAKDNDKKAIEKTLLSAKTLLEKQIFDDQYRKNKAWLIKKINNEITFFRKVKPIDINRWIICAAIIATLLICALEVFAALAIDSSMNLFSILFAAFSGILNFIIILPGCCVLLDDLTSALSRSSSSSHEQSSSKKRDKTLSEKVLIGISFIFALVTAAAFTCLSINGATATIGSMWGIGIGSAGCIAMVGLYYGEYISFINKIFEGKIKEIRDSYFSWNSFCKRNGFEGKPKEGMLFFAYSVYIAFIFLAFAFSLAVASMATFGAVGFLQGAVYTVLIDKVLFASLVSSSYSGIAAVIGYFSSFSSFMWYAGAMLKTFPKLIQSLFDHIIRFDHTCKSMGSWFTDTPFLEMLWQAVKCLCKIGFLIAIGIYAYGRGMGYASSSNNQAHYKKVFHISNTETVSEMTQFFIQTAIWDALLPQVELVDELANASPKKLTAHITTFFSGGPQKVKWADVVQLSEHEPGGVDNEVKCNFETLSAQAQ